MGTLIGLAERLEVMERKISNATANPDGLSAGGLAIVIAMIVTLDLGLLSETAACLRARAAIEATPND